MLTKKKLIEFCEEKKINVPKGASLEFLHAAVVRASLHNCSAPTTQHCFGFWENDNATCMTCDSEESCFKVSIGMEKEEYFKSLDILENKQIRMVGKMRNK
jgi:hypothetical protein